MLFKDQLEFIRTHMKRNKMRVSTTILASAMGCAFLIVLASVGFGLHKTITEDVLDNSMVTQIEVPGRESTDDPITSADTDEMRALDHVIAVVERSQPEVEGQVFLGDRSIYAPTILTKLEEEKKAGLKLAEGEMPTEAGEVVVGYHFAEHLLTEAEMENEERTEDMGFKGSLIGQEIELQLTPYEGDAEPATWTFTVAGVAAESGKDWQVDTSVYADASWGPVFVEQLELPEVYTSVLVYADDLQNVAEVTKHLKDDGYYAYSVTEELKSMDTFFAALKAGLVFVGTIAVLIASIGIFNTMTMAVTERTREIGVMKAIGAKPKLIQRLFLMESAAIGLIGTAIAVVVSYGVSILANWIVPIIILSSLDGEGGEDVAITISTIPWQLVLIAAAISITVAMVSGWRPARKATQIDVIQALRQEM
ncbi:FtsX-like permease family protein [Planomicrobium sp. YIM 101495]|nr:FtsX-like permease family protein [Planomicrobium sp. YIM 101495]